MIDIPLERLKKFYFYPLLACICFSSVFYNVNAIVRKFLKTGKTVRFSWLFFVAKVMAWGGCPLLLFSPLTKFFIGEHGLQTLFLFLPLCVPIVVVEIIFIGPHQIFL